MLDFLKVLLTKVRFCLIIYYNHNTKGINIMKLGLVTPGHTFEDVVRNMTMAGKIGYDCVELQDVDFLNIDDDGIKRLLDVAGENNLTIASLSAAYSHLDADPVKKEEANKATIRAMELAHKFGTDIVMTNAYSDLTDTIEGNIKKYKETFGEYARAAEANGVKLVIENCPHMVREPIRFGNLAFSPEMWEVLFNEVPSDAIGLEYDPSHLIWQGIDIPLTIKMYKKKIFAFHAKDTQIIKENLALVGIMGKNTNYKFGGRWWKHRLPGLGDIDWREVFRALYDIRYDGPVFLEQEDDSFSYGSARFEEGCKFAYNFLKPYMLDMRKEK